MARAPLAPLLMDNPVPQDPRSELARLRAEVAALRRQADLSALSERVAGVGTWTWDFATDAVAWSEVTLQLHGLEPGEFGRDIDAVVARVHPEDRARIVEIIARQRSAPQPFETRYRTWRQDGTVRWVLGRGQPLRTANGEVEGLLGVLYDVSREEEHALALQRQESRWTSTADAIRLGTWEATPEERLPRWCPQALQLHGLDPGNPMPSLDEIAERVHPADRDKVVAQYRPLFRDWSGPIEFDHELRVVHSDGRQRWLHASARAERDESGEIHVLRATLLDVTERHELEQQLLRAQKMESIGRLAGGIAHNFNNQFTIILGALSILEDVAHTPDTEKALTAIYGAIERSGKLTHELLSFGRRHELVVRPTDLRRSLLEIEALLRPLLGEHIEVHVRCGSDLPAVHADPARLEQVLVNMALNARDAMPEGGALVFTAAPVGGAATAGGQERVRLIVRDTGIGMDAQTLKQIFDPFFTTKPKGAGLGLASAYGMVRQMGGTLDVSSEPNRGTRFVLELPIAEGERGGGESLRREPATRGAGEVVLLVEDEPVLRELVAQALGDAGYFVLTAPNASVGARRVADHGPELALIISDAVMPGLSGVDFLRRVRDGGHHVPTLLMTGYLDRADDEARAVADRQMRKPFSPEALLGVVREMIAAAPKPGAAAREAEA